MYKILNFGSLNVDYVYNVDHFVQPGETLASLGSEVFPGGKGLNQSIALAKAGADVYQAGKIGADGEHLVELLQDTGVHTELIDHSGSLTGRAIIQVNRSGQNCILIDHGANFEISDEYMDRVFEGFGKNDILVLQNEVNGIDKLIDRAHKKCMNIAFNPSPIGPEIKKCDFSKITWFLMNEIEGYEITGETTAEKILDKMIEFYPKVKIILTIGKNGVMYHEAGFTCSHGTYKVPVVDTTAAGDTFTGFFISSIAMGKPVEEALRIASIASSIAVSRRGAAVSIPVISEVLSSELELGN